MCEKAKNKKQTNKTKKQKQNKPKPNKQTKQNKTKQNKTKQNQTNQPNKQTNNSVRYRHVHTKQWRHGSQEYFPQGAGPAQWALGLGTAQPPHGFAATPVVLAKTLHGGWWRWWRWRLLRQGYGERLGLSRGQPVLFNFRGVGLKVVSHCWCCLISCEPSKACHTLTFLFPPVH